MNEARVEELGLTLARYFARMFKLNLINPLTGFVDGDARQPDREILYVNPMRVS